MRRLFPGVLLLSIGLTCFGASTVAAKESWSIVVNVPEYRIHLYRDNGLFKAFPLAVGKPSTPTPIGRFSIKNRIKNPTWWPLDGRPPVKAGPDNPLGPWWMGINIRYGIHGGGKPDSVGRPVTHGCMRMYDKDVSELAKWVRVGTPVSIEYRLFRPLATAEGWKVRTFANIYSRAWPTADEVAESFAQAGFKEQTDWELVTALIRASKGETRWVPIKKPLAIGPLNLDSFVTPEQTWIAADAALGLIWLCSVGDVQFWQAFDADLREKRIGRDGRWFVNLETVQSLLKGKLAIMSAND